MRALTLWRPWDHAIVHGPKRVENRPWPCPPRLVGQPIAVHSGRRYDGDAAGDMLLYLGHRCPPSAEWPAGYLVGVMTVDRVVEMPVDRVVEHRATQLSLTRDPIVEDPWFTGPFGWVLRDVVALERPVGPVRGFQGLWTVSDELATRVKEQLR